MYTNSTDRFVHITYSTELESRDPTDSVSSTSSMDIHFRFDNTGTRTTKVSDK